MIDMHCHIIPNVDDGSKNINETIEMAKRAMQSGYSGIFATSHFIDKNYGTKKDDVENSVFVINKILKEKNIGIELYTGNEVYYSDNIVELIEEKKVCTLAGSKYVLFELPMSGIPLGFNNEINKMLRIGYIPIIAHPERYEFTTKKFKILQPLIKDGVLLQCNIGSIVGRYGKTAQKNLLNLLKHNMVHLFGTDAHSPRNAYDDFDKATKKIKKIVGEKRFNEIFEKLPNAILKDEVVSVWDPSLK
ncbi:MAG: CpsB/CapC family capsule biosynthesis tyrosine phosphatase [Clostridia bacterium]